MSKKPMKEENLPSVSKQTAGGVTGAVIGGMVAGPWERSLAESLEP